MIIVKPLVDIAAMKCARLPARHSTADSKLRHKCYGW